VDHVEDLAFEKDGTVWCGGEEGQVYRGRLDGAALNQPTNIAFVPGTNRLVAANIGDRYLSAFEYA